MRPYNPLLRIKVINIDQYGNVSVIINRKQLNSFIEIGTYSLKVDKKGSRISVS